MKENIINRLFKNLFNKKVKENAGNESEEVFSDTDYLHLTEIYFKNKWIRHKANYTGFEVLWSDFTDSKEKAIIKKLISSFRYLTNEEADELCLKSLKKMILQWKLNPLDTLFVATKMGPSPDGSNNFMGYIKDILHEINEAWSERNLFTSIEESKHFLISNPTKRSRRIRKIVLMDDFVGTGKTADERMKHFKEDLADREVKIYFFALAGMELGFKLLKKNNREFISCIELKKGTELSYPIWEREKVLKKITNMESILSEKIKKRELKDHSLGWGKSEALYTWTRFNIPNNVYPIFWWRKYKDNGNRKTMFNRMQ
ncbi:hypothetical protein SAMN04489761_0083 [Tenacibaculum sp. MAR_2009_124]|uniref:phosphoribosyltransferase-like protein n=1 Tax=Tenacibaculum sp. MAR_2009_124 TaxID=1250059 RepID=UPI00089A7500|nr:hypothetical protein [Tenacibaculum sp. MAR_2009_124]SEB35685.1 hypothetical protein SAMN04489761_0083 [Tenacibaculum sp. MAR_2009_124]